ncbi:MULTISPECIES: OB-fold domain-containing protein [Microcella]|uniref:Zn-ribbon domain-containing OB-fold protein n=1 Tax=Microcella TaxID=337004 RepID=UPI0015CF1CDF|nr:MULTISPECIES: OB-fold domain-containing protein [Microcella]QOD94397.1 OB-fold domain-containing protein [Chryseoglobus sp. 28M-23]
MTYDKPLPVPTDGSGPFWEACKRHELTIQECTACGHRRWPIGPVCTNCLSPEHVWVVLPGTGEVLSWIVYHQSFNQAWTPDLPYNVALIRVDGAHTMISNVVKADLDAIEIGQRVEVVFDDVTAEFAIPKFRPVA